VKLALDVHGVITAKPEFFSRLSHAVVAAGGEVHVITGSSANSDIFERLTEYNIAFTHFYSLLDHCQNAGYNIRWEGEKFYTDPEKWNVIKRDYCEKHCIDLLIDDSPEYGENFPKGSMFACVNVRTSKFRGSEAETL
jgi:hypothetical protein